MPISNSWLNSDLTAILEALSGLELTGTGGNAAYRFAASSKIVIPAGEEIVLVPATSEKVQREISLKMLTGGDLQLSWETPPNWQLEQLRLTSKNNIFKDSGDGGLQLSAKATVETELEIIVRSDSQIDYKLGGVKAVAIVGVRLLIDTTKDYTADIGDWSIVDKVQQMTQSDDGLTGYKLFQITGFNPHEELTFNVDASSASNYIGNKIDVQWLSFTDAMKVMFKIGINRFMDIDVYDILRGYEGLGGVWSHAGSVVDVTGGELKLKPDFGVNIGRFVTNYRIGATMDTCVITGYTPNPNDTEQGGTFTLGGF